MHRPNPSIAESSLGQMMLLQHANRRCATRPKLGTTVGPVPPRGADTDAKEGVV